MARPRCKTGPVLIVLALVAALLLVAACGRDDAGPERGPQQTVVSADAEPDPNPPVLAERSGPVSAPRTSQSSQASTSVVSGLVNRRDPAPELQGTGGWLNSEPFTLRSQEGKVVLVDFWTYSCVNCLRTLPYLRSWYQKYADKGLVVLGVHSPEFEFEKVLENVATAVEDLGIAYAVVQDNEFETWRAFDNHFWPAKYLIDKDGNIRYVRHGEGAYDETEDKIRELLAEAGFDVSDIPPHTEPSPTIDPNIKFIRDPAAGLTRELYAGFRRNQRAVQEFLRPWVLHSEFDSEPSSDILYKDPGGHESGYLYLEGLWRNQPESLVHARETDTYTDYLAMRFYGTSANSVMAPGPTGPSTVWLTIDGGPVPEEWAGADVLFDTSGNSYLLVNESRMYRLIELPRYGGHELRLATDAPGLELFAFTFGSYESGP